MAFLCRAWLPALGALVALYPLACSGGDTSTAAGTGGATSSSTAPATTGATTTATTATAGSGGTDGGPTGSGGGMAYVPSGFVCSGKTPSLSNDVVPITSASCTNGASCHVALHTANGLKNMFVGRLAEECNDGRLMVDPGKPEGSYVIHKITNHNLCAMQPAMPQVGAPLPADKIQIIYDWICAGAPSN